MFPVSTLDLVEERVGGGDGDPDVGVHAPDDGLELGVDIRGVARVAWAGDREVCSVELQTIHRSFAALV